MQMRLALLYHNFQEIARDFSHFADNFIKKLHFSLKYAIIESEVFKNDEFKK